MAAVNAQIAPGDNVAIWGCGPVGQFAIRSAHTTQICDILSDPPPKLRDLSKVGSKRGLATTDADIR
jgi:threonine dehydrogenase-like Zn-dependent dehydrogenase